MAEPRVSLSKKQLETPAGAELLKLCQSIKSDGQLSKDDIINLANWLAVSRRKPKSQRESQKAEEKGH